MKEISTAEFLKLKELPRSGIVLVYGTEELLHKNVLRKLREHFGDYNLYFGDDLSLEDFLSVLGEKNLFSRGGGAVNVVWKAEKFLSKLKKKEKARLTNLLGREIANLVVLNLTVDLKKSELSKEPYRSLFERATLRVSAKSLNRKQVAVLIKRRFESVGVRVGADVVKFLLENFTDLVELKNELDKLITYAFGKKSLTLEEVKLLTEGNPRYTVFDLQNALFDRNISRALEIFEALLKGLTSYEITPLVLQLEGLILSTANRLLLAAERVSGGEKFEDFARELGLVFPFQIAQHRKWLEVWKAEELEGLIGKLYTLDANLKLKFKPPAEEFKRFLLSLG